MPETSPNSHGDFAFDPVRNTYGFSVEKQPLNLVLAVFDLETAVVTSIEATRANALCKASALHGPPPEGDCATPGRAVVHQGLVELLADERSLCEVFGVSSAFRRLHEMGILVAISAPTSRAVADLLIERLGWTSRALIDAVVTLDDVTVGRPFPAMIHVAMRMLSVRNAWRVVKIAGDPSGLQQGAAAGCAFTVGVMNRAHPKEVLERHPHTHLVTTASIVPELIRRIERPGSSFRHSGEPRVSALSDDS